MIDTHHPTGIIFDIERCALHDGPGIRTTVFLKGCPLSCMWCHNPEAMALKPQLVYRADKCAGCQSCAQVCPNTVHTFVDGVHQVDFSACATCGACVAACPEEALRIMGYEMSVEAVLDIAEQDRAYYAASGGGLTISGGEPLHQFSFTRALIAAARTRGLHVCLDTSGFAARKVYAAVVDDVDIFLLDFKGAHPDRHRAHTGVDPALIWDNLDFLANQGATIHLRCPLIPGVNDRPDDLAKIAEFAARYPQIQKIDLMAYHDVGRGKWRDIGLDYALDGKPSATQADQDRWLSALRELGLERVGIG